MSEQVFHRKSIKIRKSIKRQFCDCWGMKVISVDGNPTVILGDSLSTEDIETILGSFNEMGVVYFTQPIKDCEDKIEILLNNGIPVWIKTRTTIPEALLRKMGEIPHSAIHVPMEFLSDSTPSLLGIESSSIKQLRKMMFLAKSLRVSVALCVDYQPMIMKKLDILELIEMNKMLARHVLVSFPPIPDDYFHSNRNTWENIKENGTKQLKTLYEPVYKNRSWVLKDSVKQQFLEYIQIFVKNKKINVESLSEFNNEKNRIRYSSSGLCEFPLGMKPFFYYKDRDTLQFIEMNTPPASVCPKCGKSIFA